MAGLELTEERVLQTQETVFLGGSHYIGLACSGGCGVDVSSSLGWRNEVDGYGGVAEEVLGAEPVREGCKRTPASVSPGLQRGGKSGQSLRK